MSSKNTVLLLVLAIVIFSFFLTPYNKVTGKPTISVYEECPECAGIGKEMDDLVAELDAISRERTAIKYSISRFENDFVDVKNKLDVKIAENEKLWSEVQELGSSKDQALRDYDSCKENCQGEECSACVIMFRSAEELNDRMVKALDKYDFNNELIQVLKQAVSDFVSKLDSLHSNLEDLEYFGERLMSRLDQLDQEFDECVESCRNRNVQQSAGEYFGIILPQFSQEEVPIVQSDCMTFGQCQSVCAAVDCVDRNGCYECDVSVPHLVGG